MTSRHALATRLLLGAMWLVSLGLVTGKAAGQQATGPLATPQASGVSTTADGAALFRNRCAECHGADGRGVAGHDLTRLWAGGATDAQVFQTIRNGVPNTIMPSSSAPDVELWAVVSHLRGLGGLASADTGPGDIERGARLFQATCSRCHRVNGAGGRLGPDLSRLNQTREQLTAAIRTPNAAFPPGFEPVTLVTRDGRRLRAVRKSEDAFSVQVMDERERLQGYLKSTLRDVTRDTTSLMPAFGTDTLSGASLDDLLRYLATLRPAATRRP